MTTTLTKSLKVILVVAVAALSTACAQNTSSYGVADYSYQGMSGGYSSSTSSADVFSEF